MVAPGSILSILAAFCALAIVLGLAILLMRARRSRLATADSHDVHGGDIVLALPIAVAYFDTDDRLRQVNSKLLQLLPMVHALGDREISRLEFFQAFPRRASLLTRRTGSQLFYKTSPTANRSPMLSGRSV